MSKDLKKGRFETHGCVGERLLLSRDNCKWRAEVVARLVFLRNVGAAWVGARNKACKAALK